VRVYLKPFPTLRQGPLHNCGYGEPKRPVESRYERSTLGALYRPGAVGWGKPWSTCAGGWLFCKKNLEGGTRWLEMRRNFINYARTNRRVLDAPARRPTGPPTGGPSAARKDLITIVKYGARRPGEAGCAPFSKKKIRTRRLEAWSGEQLTEGYVCVRCTRAGRGVGWQRRKSDCSIGRNPVGDLRCKTARKEFRSQDVAGESRGHSCGRPEGSGKQEGLPLRFRVFED